MDSKVKATFSSQNPSVTRNQRSEKYIAGIWIAGFLPFLGIILLVTFSFVMLLLGRRKKEFHAREIFIFNTISVFESSLLLKTENGETLERMSINNIEKVLVRNVYIDNLFGEDLIAVFEFQHRYGQKPLLRYDIDERELFENMLESSGISIISTVAADS